MIGDKYNYLTIVEKWRNKRSQIICRCKCDCGNYSIVPLHKLKSERIKSCGCMRGKLISKAMTEHGGTYTILYSKWSGIKRRLYNNNDSHYNNYGAIGLDMFKDWKEDFNSFKKWALENGYNDKLTIERIDVNKGYYPNNCKWIPMKEQAHNKRNTVYVLYNDKPTRLQEISKVEGIPHKTISSRYYRFVKRNPDIKKSNITYEMLEPTEKFKGTSYKH